MSRPPGEQARIDKIKARQAMMLMTPRTTSHPLVAALLLVGFELMVLGSASYFWLEDWRLMGTGWFVGVMHILAGIFAFAVANSKE